jgi:hypothetical protein
MEKGFLRSEGQVISDGREESGDDKEDSDDSDKRSKLISRFSN